MQVCEELELQQREIEGVQTIPTLCDVRALAGGRMDLQGVVRAGRLAQGEESLQAVPGCQTLQHELPEARQTAGWGRQENLVVWVSQF